MSWGEVFKINKNMKRALNEQLRDLKFQEIKIITSSGTYTPPKTGLYKVICVGAGGDGYCYSASSDVMSGGGGGVAISILNLSSSRSYTVTVSSTASFVYSDTITLTAAAGGTSLGGTASGGDNNYLGSDGTTTTNRLVSPQPGSVGVYISDLSVISPTVLVNLSESSSSSTTVSLLCGDCILSYGGGGNAIKNSSHRATCAGKPAAIIIVPLELEE